MTAPRTRFKGIIDYYSRLIRSGKLAPGDALPSEPRLAKRHGISRTTLRRALAELVRTGLIIKKPGRGTFVASATELKKRSQYSVAVLASGVRWISQQRPGGFVENTSVAQELYFLEGITTTLAAHGRSVRIYYFHGLSKDWDDTKRRLVEEENIGVLVISNEINKVVDDVVSLGLPTVLIDCARSKEKADVVYSTDYEGMKEATLHFLGNTPGPLAFVGSSNLDSIQHTERCRGFTDACRECSREVSNGHVILTYIHQHCGPEVAEKLLRLSPFPTGIVCSDDRVAIGVMLALQKRQVLVPGDTNIIGFGGMLFCLMQVPSMSTVMPDRVTMGEEATRLLEKRLQSPRRKPRTVYVPAKLVLRGSVAQHVDDLPDEAVESPRNAAGR